MRTLLPVLLLTMFCALFTSQCSRFGAATIAPDAGFPSNADADADRTTGGDSCLDGGVRVRSDAGVYCIGATEVTNEAYYAFVSARCDGGCALDGLPPECAFKSTVVPGWDQVPFDPNVSELRRPVALVDWCDAWAYCRWSGKRLCGRIAGGRLSVEKSTSLTSEWGRACAGERDLAFPYGSAFDPEACQTALRSSNRTTVPVASLEACQGGERGLFDMTGNVIEWIDACVGDAGASDDCSAVGGGAHYDDAEKLSCRSAELRNRNQRNTDVGFRCCWD